VRCTTSLGESEDQLILRYASGLKSYIQEKMQLHTVNSLSETINMAGNVRNLQQRLGNPVLMVEHLQVKRGGIGGKGPLRELPKDSKGMPLEPCPKNSQVKCYRCQALGHKSNNFPKKREVAMVEQQADSSESDEDNSDQN